ncbi:MAG: hypothetical protein JW881_00285 [Spirochaetales bacterium]|nr:hypothetical protein [Spirochaetales bacterium]
MVRNHLLLSFIFLMTSAFPISGLEPSLERITIYLWCDLEPFISEENEEIPLSREEASRRALEEARIIISGMIYGYSFTYIPYDRSRQAQEVFDLVPVAEIKWGDPYLKIVDSEVHGKRLFLTITYTLQAHQARRLQSWKSVAFPVASGKGESDFFSGYKEKRTSLSNAVKEAVRNHLRKRLANKPREITGEVILASSPDTFVRAGLYTTIVKIRLHIREIIPYRVF